MEGPVVALAGASTCAGGLLFGALCLMVRSRLRLLLLSCGSWWASLLLDLSGIVALVGGMAYNVFLWHRGGAALLGCRGGRLCAAPAFLAFGGLAQLSWDRASPLVQLEELRAAPELLGVSVCDPSRWQSSGGGLYFSDGTLLRDGRLAPALEVSVEHCRYFDGSYDEPSRWSSCRFGVRPVFRCDSGESALGGCRSESPCAWAVTKYGSPGQPASCGEGRFGLCGLVHPVARLARDCRGPGGEKKPWPECVVRQELEDGLRAAASQAGIALKGSVALNGSTPLLQVGDPQGVEEELSIWSTVWWWLAFFYVGAPLLLSWSMCAAGLAARARESREPLCHSAE